ncbi:MAG: DUF5694 domain-containing protein [Bacteroidota bacterium]
MARIYLIIATLLLANINLLASYTVQPDSLKPTIAILGTFHFAGSNDVLSLKIDDLSTEKRQREIKDLVKTLTLYKPTKIILEYPYGDLELDSLYQSYLAGEHALTINERQQLGFRLAKLMKHQHIYTADYYNDFPFEELMQYLQENEEMHLLENMIQDAKVSIMDVWQKALEESTIKEFIATINEDQYNTWNKNIYLEYFNKMGSPEKPVGVNISSKWWARNFQIMHNIDQITKPGDRVLVIFGQGHTAIWKDFYKGRGDVIYEDILGYLEK